MPWRGSRRPNRVMLIVAGVRLEVAHHGRDLGIGNPAVAAARRHVVIGDAEGEVGSATLARRALSSG